MLAPLIEHLQQSLNILQKQDIQAAAHALRSRATPALAQEIPNGDDCAAIPDGDGYLLLAAEGMSPTFLQRDPWFAGWCAVMVNVSDVAAMGGWPMALVDAIWSESADASQAVWAGMTAAAQTYGVPIVGGHSNCSSPYPALAAAILGRAETLITSFAAKPGDVLLVVMDLRGQFYQDYPFWNAATETEPARLRGDLALLPQIAQAGLCCAGKDISMGGIAGTLLMLMETSGVGAVLELDALPKPERVPWEKWLTCFPSFGYLLAVSPNHVAAVSDVFQAREISCAQAGRVLEDPQVYLQMAGDRQPFWNLKDHPLTGFSHS